MQRFRIVTLVDITETRLYRQQPGSEQAWSQQQNFAMLLQAIGMRANPIYINGPIASQENISNYRMGSNYNGLQKVWSFVFDIEYHDAFLDNTGNHVGFLLDDLHYVPIVSDLTETVKFKLPVFDTKHPATTNTLVYFD